MEQAAEALIGRFTQPEIQRRMWKAYQTFAINWFKSMLHVAAHRYFLSDLMNVIVLEDALYTADYYLRSFDMPGALTLILAQCVCNVMMYELKGIWGTTLILTLLMTWYPEFCNYVETKGVKHFATLPMETFFKMLKQKNSSYIIFYLIAVIFNYSRNNVPRHLEDLNLAAVLLGCSGFVYFSRYEIHEVCFTAYLMCLWMSLKSQKVQRRYSRMIPHITNVL